MPEKFKLTTDFTPKGDQPQAIEKLTEGILAGKKHQVLLGVTGSGKSLDYNEPIWVYEKRKNGFYPQLLPIGELVEKKLSGEWNDKEYFSLAINPLTCETDIQPIGDYLRHEAPPHLWEIQTECGRETIVTGDHNLWVLRNGKLKLLPTDQIQIGDYIPIPKEIPAPQIRMERLDLLTFFNCCPEKIYIRSPQLWKKWATIYGKEGLRKRLKAFYDHPWEIVFHLLGDRRPRGSSLPINVFYSLIQKFPELIEEDDLKTVEIHTRGKYHLPSSIPLDGPWLEFFGFFLAEGHATDRFITISVRTEEMTLRLLKCLKHLDLTFFIRPDGDVQISNRLIALFCSKLIGSRAFAKKLPFFWPSLSQKQLGLLMASYFDGDGSVEKNGQLVMATASLYLARQFLWVFLRLGIWARMQQRWKRATNTNHEGNMYYYVTVSGVEQIQKFLKHIPIQHAAKKERSLSLIQRTPHTNVDLIPANPDDLKSLRIAAGLYTTKLPGITHSAISMFESGKRRPKRKTMEFLLDLYEEKINAKDCSQEIRGKLRAVRSLLNVRWSRIRQVGSFYHSKKYVYDVSVPGWETFLAGQGGLFVHNTFSMANIIANINKPTLVIAPNKTLAAQLFAEFKELFPDNAVEYFISYYDYYQPEAYVPAQDLYIEKDSAINEQIDRLRHSATHALLTRRDVIIVASVSCIYGLGSPEAYHGMLLRTMAGKTIERQALLKKLIEIQYERNDFDFHRGTFRVHGDSVEIFPAYEDCKAVRLEFFGDELEKIIEIDPLTAEKKGTLKEICVYPASHFVTPENELKKAIKEIEKELASRIQYFKEHNQLLEAQRIEQRTRYDLEMLAEMGRCKGIENYSRYFTGRKAGEPPPTLLEYFPRDFLLFIDESHITVPQIGGMYEGDRSRKTTLVEYGFRLPSALDNRPLKFAEFEGWVDQTIYVSATPAEYELKKAKGEIVEQVVRPTGLIDPRIIVRTTQNQVDDLRQEILKRVSDGERVLITTLTKRMAEQLADFYREKGVKVRYLHSDVESLERVEILRDLRKGVFDVLIGINLLREGLDLPEVSLVAILDADKEGFLRSERSLIQTFGRAARNVHGTVILYADSATRSMQKAIAETNRRRKKQEAYNKKHGITPATIQKKISDVLHSIYEKDYPEIVIASEDLPRQIEKLRKEMLIHAKNLEFEEAATLRDQIQKLEEKLLHVA